MNKNIVFGKDFALRSLVKYEEGKVVTTEVMSNDEFKVILMAFDEDMKLDEHAAPGDAIAIALKGKAVITYEGKKIKVKEGDSVAFAKGAKHAVQAKGKFKMALILNLEKVTPASN